LEIVKRCLTVNQRKPHSRSRCLAAAQTVKCVEDVPTCMSKKRTRDDTGEARKSGGKMET